MHRSSFLPGLALGLLAAPCLAQPAPQPVGFNFNVAAGATSRGFLGSAPGEVMQRIDSVEIAGWATEAANPGMHVIHGATWIVQDQDALATGGETYSLKFYTEDPAMPDFPDINNPPANAVIGPFTGPAITTGGPEAAMLVNTTFATPVMLPRQADVFVSFDLPAAPGAGWNMDGVSIQLNLGFSPGPGFTTWDIPGPGAINQASYSLTYNQAGVAACSNNPMCYNTARQLMVDLLAMAPGGGATAITNQTTYTISNTPPGTASFFSALHPDVANPPLNVGRQDDVGYVFLDVNSPDGTPVFFLAEFSPIFNPAEPPLSGFVSGSEGVACFMPTTASIGLGNTLNGEASIVLTIPMNARNLIAGLPLAMGAVALDLTNVALRGGPCSIAQF